MHPSPPLRQSFSGPPTEKKNSDDSNSSRRDTPTLVPYQRGGQRGLGSVMGLGEDVGECREMPHAIRFKECTCMMLNKWSDEVYVLAHVLPDAHVEDHHSTLPRLERDLLEAPDQSPLGHHGARQLRHEEQHRVRTRHLALGSKIQTFETQIGGRFRSL